MRLLMRLHVDFVREGARLSAESKARHAAIAERLRRHVYASGGTVDPAQAFRALGGRDPLVGPMRAQRGLAEDRQPA